MTRANPHLC